LRKTEPSHIHGDSEAKSTLTTIAIRSINGAHPALDCYLAQVDRSLALIKNDEELEAVQIPSLEV